MVKHARRHDHEIGAFDLSIHLDLPFLTCPFRARHLRIQAQVRPEAEAVHDFAVVVEDLLARREHSLPIRLEVEGVLVELRGHVAAEARVVVPVPGAADVRALFEHDEVLEAAALERDAHCDAGHTGPDDHDSRGARPLGHRPFREKCW
jgi:hypothetical protein